MHNFLTLCSSLPRGFEANIPSGTDAKSINIDIRRIFIAGIAIFLIKVISCKIEKHVNLKENVEISFIDKRIKFKPENANFKKQIFCN